MKTLIAITVFFASIASLMAGMTSPNGLYKVEYTEGKIFTQAVFKSVATDKVLFSTTTSGWSKGSYVELSWSPDSKYLAVVSRGTKTTMDLEVYLFEGDVVTKLVVPSYRLNLLGRHHLVKGGRYKFAKNIKWVKNGITFTASGSLVDGASNPSDSPANWYFYDVLISVNGHDLRLKSVEKSGQHPG